MKITREITKKITRKIIPIALIVSIMFAFAGCGEIKKAEAAVDGMFSAFKKIDFEEAQKFVNVDEITSSDDDSDARVETVMKNVFDNLDYEIISSEKIDNNKVIVKTKITATDMKPVMGNFFSKALEYTFSNILKEPQPTEEEVDARMEEILIECTSQPDLATVTNEIDINVVKNENGEWKIDVDDTFINAVLGGLSDAVNEIDKLGESE